MLAIEALSKSYNGSPILSNVSFCVGAGEIIGLVGQSGSGKSTIAKCILGLERPDSGRLMWHGHPLSERAVRRDARKSVQAVFQDPRSSLNPRWTIRQILSEPLNIWRKDTDTNARNRRIAEVLGRVELAVALLDRYPHELSTGQCQRICLARALATDPDLLILDEPLSALDVSTQTKLIDLLLDLHRQTGMSYLIITHDFAVVSDMCRDIIVLERGHIVEQGPVETVLSMPQHAYTKALLNDILPMPQWTLTT